MWNQLYFQLYPTRMDYGSGLRFPPFALPGFLSHPALHFKAIRRAGRPNLVIRAVRWQRQLGLEAEKQK